MLEKHIKQKLKVYLDSINAYQFWPVQTGYGKATLDCLVCELSVFVAFETKAPGKKPTRRQALTIHEIRQAGGEVYVVDYEVPPLRSAVTGDESWYPTFAKESPDIRRDQACRREQDND